MHRDSIRQDLVSWLVEEIQRESPGQVEKALASLMRRYKLSPKELLDAIRKEERGKGSDDLDLTLLDGQDFAHKAMERFTLVALAIIHEKVKGLTEKPGWAVSILTDGNVIFQALLYGAKRKDADLPLNASSQENEILKALEFMEPSSLRVRFKYAAAPGDMSSVQDTYEIAASWKFSMEDFLDRLL